MQDALLDEIDARKLAEGGTIIDSVEREVRGRLQQKAFLQKTLLKLPGAHGEGASAE